MNGILVKGDAVGATVAAKDPFVVVKGDKLLEIAARLGVPLKTVLDKAGVKAAAREFVFFGADKGEEEVEFRALGWGRSSHRITIISVR